jgi:hypothetical protein
VSHLEQRIQEFSLRMVQRDSSSNQDNQEKKSQVNILYCFESSRAEDPGVQPEDGPERDQQ